MFAGVVATLTLATLFALPTSALASRGLVTGFADGIYASPDSATRSLWYGRTVQARAGIVRVNLRWRSIATAQPVAPTDPADPAYDFASVDRAVRSAAARGLPVLLTVFEAPAWAEGPRRPQSVLAGTWKPSPTRYGAFARAVARRYSGNFLDPLSIGTLPRVRYFQAWNEANLSDYLTPQWKNRKQKGALVYRRLLNAFYEGVKAVDRSNVVVSTGTAPYGDPPGGSRTRPVTFWRAAFCLKGPRLKRKKCPKAAQARFDVLAHHPINTSGGPLRSAISPNDASSPDMGRIRRVLRAAQRHRTIRPRGSKPLWATEMWWESNPPDKARGYRPKVQARFIEQTMYLIWKAGARVAINLQIRDAPFDPADSIAYDQTGVFYSDGRPKPSFRAFRFPFVADRLGRAKVRVWGKAPGAGKVRIERRIGGRWRRIRTARARGNHIFTKRLRFGRGRLRARFGSEASLAWPVR